jgi:hypothetical protein
VKCDSCFAREVNQGQAEQQKRAYKEYRHAILMRHMHQRTISSGDSLGLSMLKVSLLRGDRGLRRSPRSATDDQSCAVASARFIRSRSSAANCSGPVLMVSLSIVPVNRNGSL